MPIHGEVRKMYEREHLVMNEKLNNKEKVVELSRLEKHTIKEVYCAKCENWQETDSRYFITDICCPTCCANWE